MPRVNNTTQNIKALVVGSGSIGRRHAQNLRKLGVEHIAVCDTDAERIEPLIEELGVESYTDYGEALGDYEPDVVLVCTPPVYHVEQSLAAIRTGAGVFVEKPLSNSVEGVDDFISEAERTRSTVQVGYNLRFHKGMKKLIELVEEGAIGKILWARAEMGQYLPDWRPWQDYRKSYTARSDLGGGIILDASHELDYIIRIMGRPESVSCVAVKASDLEMDTEDSATILLQFGDGRHADVHVDCIQRHYERSYKMVGSEGELYWDYSAQEIKVYRTGDDAPEVISVETDPNDMYLDEMRHFLECVRDGKSPEVNLKDGRTALEVALAAKASAKSGKQEQL